MRQITPKLFLSRLRTTGLAGVILVLAAFFGPALQADDLAKNLPAVPTSVNVNVADAPTIATILKGVGLARAQAIVEYRETHGAFSDLEALREVKGLGEVTLNNNSSKIRFKD